MTPGAGLAVALRAAEQRAATALHADTGSVSSLAALDEALDDFDHLDRQRGAALTMLASASTYRAGHASFFRDLLTAREGDRQAIERLHRHGVEAAERAALEQRDLATSRVRRSGASNEARAIHLCLTVV